MQASFALSKTNPERFFFDRQLLIISETTWDCVVSGSHNYPWSGIHNYLWSFLYFYVCAMGINIQKYWLPADSLQPVWVNFVDRLRWLKGHVVHKVLYFLALELVLTDSGAVSLQGMAETRVRLTGAHAWGMYVSDTFRNSCTITWMMCDRVIDFN